jgi:polyphosphate glucokinase
VNESLGIDVGGSAIKAGLVDCVTGAVVSDLVRVATPSGGSLASCLDEFVRLVRRFDAVGAIGVALPTVLTAGTARTAANIAPEWIGAPIARMLSDATGRGVVVLNDADAAGIAEMRLGSGRDVEGTVLVLTFGTGIGSALFSDGHLFPNTELGRMVFGTGDAEEYASARARARDGLDWLAWAARVNSVLERYHALLWPDLLIVGGGVSEHWEAFGHLLRAPAPIVPARFRHTAGVVGAALAASGRMTMA